MRDDDFRFRMWQHRRGFHRHPGWHHHHGHWWPHGRLRHYYGAHLHRRIFLWFCVNILATSLVVSAVIRLMRWHSRGDAPPGLFVVGLPAFAVMFLISGKIARRIARPLNELVDVVTEIGRGNLAARATESPRGFDEVGRVAHAVNEMAARIDRQMAGQRELLAAVSHELRTPLARLRVLLDIARDRGANESVFTEWERELLEMDQLVGELLASARLDFQALTRSPLDAIDLARRALLRAGEPPERLSATAAQIRFSGDPTLLGRALANLLENARKHGRGLVRLAVIARPRAVIFAIEDRGPGIPAALAERVFEPFVQAGAGPAPDGEQVLSHASLGLGLALVARIARAHGGRAYAEHPPEGGACFVLELPLPNEPAGRAQEGPP